MDMPVIMNDGLVDVKMSVLLTGEQERPCHHQDGSDHERPCNGILKDNDGKNDTCQRRGPIKGAGAGGAQAAHGIDEQHGGQTITDKAQ